MLTIQKLSKTYTNGVKALSGLDLEIGTGMFGLLGPNGAGKSTLMRTVATLQQPDSGSITFQNVNVLEDPIRLRYMLGYLPQEFGVYPNVSAEKLLDYFATLKGIDSTKERKILVSRMLELTNLQDVRRKYVSSFSGGMKQRFGIAQLLLNDPKLIIVDEPTAGLDPAERQRFLNLLRQVGTEATVIFSTHIVEDVAELCHEIAVMNHGKVLSQGAPDKLCSNLQNKVWTTIVARNELDVLADRMNVLSSQINRDNSLTARVLADTNPGEGFEFATPNLEDVYFYALSGLQKPHSETGEGDDA